MKFTLAFLFLMSAAVFSGCAKSSDQPSSRRIGTPAKKVLSESESFKYVTATIYYIPDYSATDVNVCGANAEFNIILSKTQNKKIKTCKKIFDNCLMQGSCYVNLDSQKVMINYNKKLNGVYFFKIVDTTRCKFGMGDSNDGSKNYKTMCVEPYRSVAADFRYHKLGDVIYIPSVLGVQLPDGSMHDGYFIVRDSGSAIKGRGRFDFFTGFDGIGKKNVFSGLGLGGEANPAYQLVSGGLAEKVRKYRAFPYLR
ncbi:MAG: 3D domain-containing protein [Pseudobdellovibrio sp.]